MSKRLQAPRYKALIAYLEGVMVDPKATGEKRMKAAIKLHEFYLEFEAGDSRAKAHARKLELRKLQIENPNLPLPASEIERKPVEDETVDEAVAFIRKGGTGASTV